jgi:predicted nucleic acid-binding protein
VSLVVDASVASKWVLPEPDSEQAERLRETGEELIAPSLVLAEVGNAVWKRAIRGELSQVDAAMAVRTAAALFSSLYPMEQFALRATELAVELRHPIYDCFYLALAEREAAVLVTADARMLASAKRAKVKVRQL